MYCNRTLKAGLQLAVDKVQGSVAGLYLINCI